MAKAGRPARRPFNSSVSQVAVWALQELAPEQFTKPNDLHWMILRDWRTATGCWYGEESDYWTNSQWRLMEGCDTSLLWSPRLVSIGGRRPRARFCRQRWLCPFCYGRELVAFLRPFSGRNFQFHSSELMEPSSTTIWARFQAESTQLNRAHGAVATWRYAYPASDIWVGRATWLYPGSSTFSQLGSRLAQSLAYPYGVLSMTLRQLSPYLTFMKSHRGREVIGEYREERQRNQVND